jgi:hypothetical protein
VICAACKCAPPACGAYRPDEDIGAVVEQQDVIGLEGQAGGGQLLKGAALAVGQQLRDHHPVRQPQVRLHTPAAGQTQGRRAAIGGGTRGPTLLHGRQQRERNQTRVPCAAMRASTPGSTFARCHPHVSTKS